MHRFNILSAAVMAVLAYGVLSGCQEGNAKEQLKAERENAEVSMHSVLIANAKLAYANYSDAVESARVLKDAVYQLVENPSETTMDAAKQAWLQAREPYGQTEVFRFRSGPIDDDITTTEPEDGPEGQINAWPLAEGLIDYVVGGQQYQMLGADNIDTQYPSYSAHETNLIADTHFAISKASLAEMNELAGDEANVATGYHAIEFLLWGQDLNQTDDPLRDMTGGLRSYTDYSKGSLCTHGNCDRRGQYIKAASDLLVDDLAGVTAQWNPNNGQHYQAFVKGGLTSLEKIVTAMGQLSYGELASERIKIALMSDSQEDEHSCFSDNTHRDIVLNAQGVENVYLARYNGHSFGASPYDYLIQMGQADLANTLKSQLAATMEAAAVVNQAAQKGRPFDNQIQGSDAEKANIQAVVSALVTQTNTIAEALEQLGLQTDVKDPEVTYATDSALLGNEEAK